MNLNFFRRNEGIISQHVSGTTVLLNPIDGQYYSLNEVGGRVWELCDGSRTLADIVSLLAQEFDAPEENIRSDVIELLEDMLRDRLVIAAV